MWSKQPTQSTPGSQTGSTNYSPTLSQTPAASSFNSTPSTRPNTAPTFSPSAQSLACLGASVHVKGEISGAEDLQIDGRVDGPVKLDGQRLTVGRSGQLQSEIRAREVVVFGKVTGNIHAKDRVEIKKDGSVVGDINTARISIEDGAYFKGRIEIEKGGSGSSSSSSSTSTPELVGVGAGSETN
jgi:cytoskeletal protein CcmA (bactofilin family)